MKFLSKIFGSTEDKQADGRTAFHPSKSCPECGTKLAAWDEDGAWHCPNLDCPARVRERIEHWCSPEAMNIAGADKAVVAQLVGRGLVRDVAELYSLRLAEVAGLKGRGKAFAGRLLEAVTASKTREAWRVLHGLGIPQLDAEAAMQLGRHFAAVDDILAAGPERLVKQAGVSDAVARNIAYWYADNVNRRLVRRLQKAGVNFKTAPG